MHRHHLHPLQHTIYHLQRYSSLLPCYLASRTMTNQFLAVKMVESIGEIGIINHRLRLLKQKSDEKLTVDEKASLSEGQKHKKNIRGKIHYQKIRLENIAMKAKSCLEKLRDIQQLSSPVNKATRSSNKIDFEKGEPNNQKLPQKSYDFFR